MFVQMENTFLYGWFLKKNNKGILYKTNMDLEILELLEIDIHTNVSMISDGSNVMFINGNETFITKIF